MSFTSFTNEIESGQIQLIINCFRATNAVYTLFHLFSIIYLSLIYQDNEADLYLGIIFTYILTLTFHSCILSYCSCCGKLEITKHTSKSNYAWWSSVLFVIKLVIFGVILYDYSMHYILVDPFIIVGISLILHLSYDIMIGTAVSSGFFHDLEPYLPFYSIYNMNVQINNTKV